MPHLIPAVKVLTEKPDRFTSDSIFYDATKLDGRLAAALAKLPFSNEGAPVEIQIAGTEGEGYTLDILPREIRITADSAAGAFYAIQTLRQIFANNEIPCLHVEDKPDFPYRGFYHDVTRGKIPTVETVKNLIDRMAYFKLNSLQLYVEHVFEFKETVDLQPKTSYITGAELEELDAYCKENFIEFIPSLSTFGHMYEILQQPKYHHLRVLKNYEEHPNFWKARMAHHTIDPLMDESFELVKSLIDQFLPHFSTNTFNICCDETFDLTQHERQDLDRGQMYVDFVKKIIAYLESKGKNVMMWADILLKHPETIDALPRDTCFLNWCYHPNPSEVPVEKLASLNRTQIVCPGTTTWNRLCENVPVEEGNICRFIDHGYKHGAQGVLNTNWGDWANLCSVELALYGMVLGAGKSWTVSTLPNEEFHAAADCLLYNQEGMFDLLTRASALQTAVPWPNLASAYFALRDENKKILQSDENVLKNAVIEAKSLLADLEAMPENNPFREELILTARGLWSIAELTAKASDIPLEQTADTEGWLSDYAALWREKNKESELRYVEEVFRFMAKA